MIILLGRRDEPTDAVRDYADRLGDALRRRGARCETYEVCWQTQGWLAALRTLWKESGAWRGRWVVLHYTALMWSRRGFPFAAPLLVWMLKLRGCRTAVVFHDVYAIADARWIDRLRVRLQERIMRHLSKTADRAILPVPLDSASWLPAQRLRIDFIPMGANVPSLDDLKQEGYAPTRNGIATVAVFGVTAFPAAQTREVEAIVRAVRQASATIGELRLLVMGRGAKEAESLLREGLSGTEVRLEVDGLRSDREISMGLAGCDVLLFVRGGFSSRRGSGLAAIACGLPVVAYEGRETGFPLTEAGILFVSQDDPASLGRQLAALLLDRERRQDFSARNVAVFRQWFAWDRIAERWIDTLSAEQVARQ